MKKLFLLFFVTCSLCIACKNSTQTNNNLRQDIASYLEDKNATVGISVLTDSNTVLAYNDSLSLPMLSIYKFPIALKVLHQMEIHNTSPDTLFHLTPEDLKTNTYSPICMKHPNRDVKISVDSLLLYSIAFSDNNASDILLKYAGGAQSVEQYIHNIGINQMAIKTSEDEMHQNPKLIYDNCATPLAIAKLFQIFINGNILSPTYKQYLYRILTTTSTGINKLQAGLPNNITFGHKTGSSWRTPDGLKYADHDAGFVILPNGKHYYICVMVCNSMENDSTNAAIISTISKMVYNEMSSAQ